MAVLSTMKAWQYTATRGGLEANLKLNPAVPVRKPNPNENLIQVLFIALNPIDYKPAEVPLISRLLIPKPATPGIDFAGRIITPATSSSFQPGQLVFGTAGTSPLAAGGLAEYIFTKNAATASIPSSVSPLHAATIPVAGLTAYQSIHPHVKPGSNLFINGGSGGTGTFGIQIAKILNCHVTTTCSTPNVELCKCLGADTVIDYKTHNVLDALISGERKFDLIIDNVGNDAGLYWRCHEYTTPDAVYVMIAGKPGLEMLTESAKRKFLPGILGGGKRRYMTFFPKPITEDMERIVGWMAGGELRAVVDQRFTFAETPEAFRRLKTGRARGKIVVAVGRETEGKK